MAEGTAANISAVRWTDPRGRLLGFQSSRCYGVVNAQRQVLAVGRSMREGRPSSWATLAIAREIAPHADKMVTGGEAVWIDPYDWQGKH